MAQLTLAEVISFVQDFEPDVPQAKIVRKLNLVIQELYEKLAVPQRGTFTTKAPTTTGTVSATNLSTGVTFSSSVLETTDPIRLIQIEGDTTWYTLTRTNGTTGVLSSGFAGDTGATLTYQIAYPIITYPAAVGQIIRCWREGLDQDLLSMGDEGARSRLLDPSVGMPQWRAPYIFDATGTPDDLLREELIPAPSQALSYTYVYSTRPTYIATGASTSSVVNLPQLASPAILWGTLCYVSFQRESGKSNPYYLGKFEDAKMKALAETQAGSYSQRQDIYASRPRQMTAWQTPPGGS